MDQGDCSEYRETGAILWCVLKEDLIDWMWGKGEINQCMSPEQKFLYFTAQYNHLESLTNSQCSPHTWSRVNSEYLGPGKPFQNTQVILLCSQDGKPRWQDEGLQLKYLDEWVWSLQWADWRRKKQRGLLVWDTYWTCGWSFKEEVGLGSLFKREICRGCTREILHHVGSV